MLDAVHKVVHTPAMPRTTISRGVRLPIQLWEEIAKRGEVIGLKPTDMAGRMLKTALIRDPLADRKMVIDDQKMERESTAEPSVIDDAPLT